MFDPTEPMRRQMVDDLNAEPKSREALEARYGRVWSTEELTAEFMVESFLAPFVSVVERTTGRRGSMLFQHRPRFYFDFQPNNWHPSESS